MIGAEANADFFADGMIVVRWRQGQQVLTARQLQGIQKFGAAKRFAYDFSLQWTGVVVNHVVGPQQYIHQPLIFFISGADIDATPQRPGSILLRIHTPLLWRSVLTAGLLVFVDVIKELPVTLTVRPFNFDTLAVITYQLAADERLAEATLPAFTIVMIALVPVVLLAGAIARTGR